MRLYADGSAYTVDKSGGWAWWVSDDLCDSGFVSPATNNMMEITAVLQGLAYLLWNHSGRLNEVEVISDSAYVINCMTERWYDKWKQRYWRTASNEPVANVALWQELIEVVESFPAPLVWTHVRGHGRGGSKDAPYVAGNDIVDRLAGAARTTGLGRQDLARQAVLERKPVKRKRRIKLEDLDGLVFMIEGDHRFTALDIDQDGTVLLLKEGK